MSVVGIIAEYNPFHCGHQYQIREIRRRLGEDCAIVAVMSGNYVQRGEVSVLEKHSRAEAAVCCGVDLVLELPTPWAAATAEIFARGGVSLLAATGVVTHLCFGSECGDLAALQKAAACLDSEAYSAALRRFLDSGMTFAAARQAGVEALLGEDAACLAQPNNNLGIEYLRAIRALDAAMIPMTVQRKGAAHDSNEAAEYASASAIRQRMRSGEGWKTLVPPPVAEIAAREIAAGRGPIAMSACEQMMLAKLRTMDEEAFAAYDGGNEGLYHRFYAAVRQAASVEELLDRAKTKRYTHARLRRMALAAWLDLPMPVGCPPYLRVLAANGRGCELLREMKETASLPVVTKPGHVRKLGDEAANCFAAESRYTDLYTLAWPRGEKPDREYTAGPVILQGRKEFL